MAVFSKPGGFDHLFVTLQLINRACVLAWYSLYFNKTTMSEELIIQHLKDRELTLLNELRKVRVALQAFIDDNMNFSTGQYTVKNNLNIPLAYKNSLTYSDKVLYILANQGEPMLVEEIALQIHKLEPGLEMSKLHKNISYNLSMLAKYAKVKRHAFNRKIKYSV